MDSLPAMDVPYEVLARIPATVYLVLEEDLYETRFGDGRFLYPRSASWGRRLPPPDLELLRFSVKAIEIRREADRIVADLRKDPDDRYSLADVVRLLSEAR